MTVRDIDVCCRNSNETQLLLYYHEQTQKLLEWVQHLLTSINIHKQVDKELHSIGIHMMTCSIPPKQSIELFLSSTPRSDRLARKYTYLFCLRNARILSREKCT